MSKIGYSYVVELKQAHFDWGVHRYTSSRGIVYGEGYIKIPAKDAYQVEIFNGNYGDCAIYDAKSYDGFFEGQLLAQGDQSNDRYAKQFAAWGDLKAIGSWYAHFNATIRDFVKVKFISETSLIFEFSNNSSNFHI
jgi:hypothetical protein